LIGLDRVSMCFVNINLVFLSLWAGQVTLVRAAWPARPASRWCGFMLAGAVSIGPFV